MLLTGLLLILLDGAWGLLLLPLGLRVNILFGLTLGLLLSLLLGLIQIPLLRDRLGLMLRLLNLPGWSSITSGCLSPLLSDL